MGYLYETYASHLCQPTARKMHEEEFRDMNLIAFKEKAKELFKQAYQSFEVKEHLKGMFLAKKHEAHIYEEMKGEL